MQIEPTMQLYKNKLLTDETIHIRSGTTTHGQILCSPGLANLSKIQSTAMHTKATCIKCAKVRLKEFLAKAYEIEVRFKLDRHDL